jgi:hypothetical protein
MKEINFEKMIVSLLGTKLSYHGFNIIKCILIRHRDISSSLETIGVLYRTNVVVERLKLQQELVSRGGRDLDDVREKLADTRVSILKLRDTIKRLEADAEAGVRDPAGMAAAKLELENAVQLELRLIQRDTQLMNDLSIERSKLMELNDRLTKLELELK